MCLNHNKEKYYYYYYHLILSQSSICVVNPPLSITVDITMISVVENIVRCWTVAVLRIASANAIAPRKPAFITTALQILTSQPTASFLSH